jgi:predicted GNAT family N-acyltransferase
VKFGSKFIPLDKSLHDRVTFECGEKELNLFLKTKAAKHMKARISNTLVMASDTLLENKKHPISSFYTVTPSSIERKTLPTNQAKKLPHYPVPVFLIAQLAVDNKYHGQKLGQITLIKALEFLWEINQQMPAYAVVVDCLNEVVEEFYAKFGFEVLDMVNGKVRMYIPMKVVGELF